MYRTSLMSFIGFVLLIFDVQSSKAAIYNLPPTDDSYVYQVNSGDNYNSSSLLSSTLHYTYFKFSLNEIPNTDTIVSAYLELFCYDRDFVQSHVLQYVPDDKGWSQTTIDWNNKPDASADFQSRSAHHNEDNRWYLYLNVWDYAADLSDDDNLLSLRLKGLSDSKPSYFYSMDAMGEVPSHWLPCLHLETTPVPIPGAVWLLASGFVGLLTLRNKFRDKTLIRI